MTDELLRFRTQIQPASCDSPSTLEELIDELRRRAGVTPRGRQAVQALDALMIGTEQRKTPSTGQSTWTWSTIEPLVIPLGDLAKRCEGASWCHLALALLDLVPVTDRKPALVLQLALYAPPEARAVLLAEYWHLLMIGARHSSTFAFAVALDVWGHALSSSRSCLAETLAAAARRVPAGSPWRIQTEGELTDSDPTDGNHQLAQAALRGLTDLPREFDFVAGWGLVQLRTLLAAAGLDKKALILAKTLSNHMETRADTLGRLTKSEGLSLPAQTLGSGAIRRLSVPCNFGPREQQVPVYLGRPAEGYHPLHFQNALIRAAHGGSIQPNIMARLYSL